MRRLLILMATVAGLSPAFAQSGGPDGGRVAAPVPDAPPAGTAAPDGPDPQAVDPDRFSDRPADLAYGAFQRGHYLTALNIATPLALRGDPAAQTLIAEIYSRGLGVRKDIATATEWYEKAAQQKVPEAVFQLAMILLDGGEEFGDRDRAWQLMREAAEAGHRIAQFNYAQMLIDLSRTPQDEERAVRYYERAAQAGLPAAQYAMAQIYEFGAGDRKPDAAETRRWLDEAARQGHATAQIELGTMLVEKGGSASEQKDGFSWLMRAATSGNPVAQNRVAKLYRAGVGVEPDRVAAAVWYLRARRAGLTDPVMEDQLRGLTDEELALATLNSDRLR